MSSRIFISYAHEDLGKLEQIVRLLKDSVDADIWFDKSLRFGTHFPAEIEVELSQRDFIVFLASRCSFASEFCLREVTVGMELGKPILPVFLEECEIPVGSGFLIPLSGRQQIHICKLTEDEVKEQFRNSVLARPADSSGKQAEDDSHSGPGFLNGTPLPPGKAGRQQFLQQISDLLENEEFEKAAKLIGRPEANPVFRRAAAEELGQLYMYLLLAERELLPSDDFSRLSRPVEPFSGRNYTNACRYGMQNKLQEANRQLCANIRSFVWREVDLADTLSYTITVPEDYEGDYLYLWDCLLFQTENLQTGGKWKAPADIETLRHWYAVFEQYCPTWLLDGNPPAWDGVRSSGRVRRYFEELDTLAARHNGAEEYEKGMALRMEGNKEKEAAEYLRQAAEKGHAEAQYELGLCYMVGEGVAEDLKEAGRLFRLAGDQGLMEAQRELGRCFKYGEGVDLDGAEAVRWFRRAADQGDRWAQYWTGECYNTGEGVEEDKAEAIHWFRLAANNGHTQAQYRLGRFYDYGTGVPMNKEESVRWYRKAADQGMPEAENSLGVAYAFGQGLPVDKAEGARWYRKAAEKGNAFAQYNLAMCYDHGNGVAEDKAEAMRWYRKAAEQGDEDAQYRLAIGYLRGTGVPRDEGEALRWLRMAEESGSGRAANYLKHYRRTHTEE